MSSEIFVLLIPCAILAVFFFIIKKFPDAWNYKNSNSGIAIGANDPINPVNIDYQIYSDNHDNPSVIDLQRAKIKRNIYHNDN